MVQLQEKQKELEASGGQVVAISFDPVETLKKFALQRKITFTLLSDSQSKVIDLYGIRNHEAPDQVKGIPHPTTFIIDRKRVIRERLAELSYQERPSVEVLIAALKKVGTP